MTRSEKSTRNALAACIYQVIYLLLTFVIRFVMIKFIGLTAVSLNGLFTEVISMLSLVELGVGSAIVYNLYKPLAEHDTVKLTALMTLFKKAYRTIAIVMFVIGLCLLPRIDLFVSKIDVSMGYLRLVYLLFLIKTASSYLLAYKISLINADQKAYIVSICNIITKSIFTVIELIVILCFKNFILYLILEIILVFATNITISMIADKRYPFLKENATLPKEESRGIFQNIKNIFITTICTRITSSTDNILISTLVGTLQVGIYSQYSMVINGVNTMIRQINNGAVASIGHVMMQDSKEHCHEIMCNLTFLNFMIGSVCGSCLLTMLNPFITIVFGKQYILDNITLFVICYNFFLATICHCIWNFTNVSGLFAKDKNIGIIGTVFNLIVSIIFGKYCGMVGIFAGTALTHFIQGELKIRLLYNENFHMDYKLYSLKWWKYMMFAAIEMIIVFQIYLNIPFQNVYLQFIYMAIISVVFIMFVNLLLFKNTEEYQYAKKYIQKLVKKVVKK